jgi:hypothetical protein
MRGLYRAEVGGASSRVRDVEFRTIGECRGFAEGFGSTADWCNIYDWKGRKVGEHRRDTNGRGTDWFRVPWQPEWKVA